VTPAKPRGDRAMERMLNLRVSNQFMEALEETKWTLRKNVAEVVREAILEYMKRNLPKDALLKVNKLLEDAPEKIK
jgi:GTPase Era involved in 16S rRNA processing